MNIKIIREQDSNPIGRSKVYVVDAGRVVKETYCDQQGTFTFEDAAYSGKLLDVVVTSADYGAEGTFRYDDPAPVSLRGVKPVPWNKDFPNRIRRYGRRWLWWLAALTVIFALEGVLIYLSELVSPEGLTGNYLLVLLSSVIMIARYPLYRWLAALATLAAHVLSLTIIFGFFGLQLGNKTPPILPEAVCVVALLVAANIGLVILLDRKRRWIRAIPLLGKRTAAESVRPARWELLEV